MNKYIDFAIKIMNNDIDMNILYFDIYRHAL